MRFNSLLAAEVAVVPPGFAIIEHEPRDSDGELETHLGPPPHVGWWQATTASMLHAYRHWDGTQWRGRLDVREMRGRPLYVCVDHRPEEDSPLSVDDPLRSEQDLDTARRYARNSGSNGEMGWRALELVWR